MIRRKRTFYRFYGRGANQRERGHADTMLCREAVGCDSAHTVCQLPEKESLSDTFSSVKHHPSKKDLHPPGKGGKDGQSHDKETA